jgi:hypothetical protein
VNPKYEVRILLQPSVAVTELYRLVEVVRRTGAKRRAIQLWADGGVIFSTAESDRAGTGTHRLFEEMEVQIAALLVPLANLGLPIGILKRFAHIIRQALFSRLPGAVSAMLEEGTPRIGRALSRAVRREGGNWLLFAYTPEWLHIEVATDENGPISIDLDRFIPGGSDKNAVIVALNLTNLLGSARVSDIFWQ